MTDRSRVHRVDITREGPTRDYTVRGQYFHQSWKADKNAKMLATLLPETVTVSVVDCEKDDMGVWRDIGATATYRGNGKDFQGAPEKSKPIVVEGE